MAIYLVKQWNLFANWSAYFVQTKRASNSIPWNLNKQEKKRFESKISIKYAIFFFRDHEFWIFLKCEWLKELKFYCNNLQVLLFIHNIERNKNSLNIMSCAILTKHSYGSAYNESLWKVLNRFSLFINISTGLATREITRKRNWIDRWKLCCCCYCYCDSQTHVDSMAFGLYIHIEAAWQACLAPCNEQPNTHIHTNNSGECSC